MQSIFLSAKQKVTFDLDDPVVTDRLDTIDIAVVETDTMDRTLKGDHYRRAVRIPAYYDPNYHRVYLNRVSLEKSSVTTRFIICYHELVHAASHHSSYQFNKTHIFQSGIKIEQYKGRRYSCSNRLFNEGIVQALTTHNNNVNAKSYAYAQEVELIFQVIDQIGRAPVMNALLFGDYQTLVKCFDAGFGTGSFQKFAELLDAKKYIAAKQVITLSPHRTFRFSYLPQQFAHAK